MRAERWRCFVAVPIGEALRVDLRLAMSGWPRVAGLRWIDPAAWHLTLVFLGQVEPSQIPSVADRLREVAANVTPVQLSTGGLGAFPSAGRARVAWYGVGDPDGLLAKLASDLAGVLGVVLPSTFRPHVTIGRAGRQPRDLSSWLAAAAAPAGVLGLDRIELMRSHHGTGSARYEVLATMRIGVPAHA